MSRSSGACRGRELFVWYRVASDSEVRARTAVETMQRALESDCPGLRARLLIRTDDTGAQTWMETYAMHGAGTHGVDGAVEDRIAAAAAELGRWLDGDRHTERFEAADRS